jgi:hypothetical protein
MNVFEDLIGELKDENLLEDTVIEIRKADAGSQNGVSIPPATNDQPAGFEVVGNDEVADSPDIANHVHTLQSDEPEIVKPKDESEFFRKRAMEEVSSLQMVEHVLGGVEREHFKTPAATYDDLKVKKALHTFMKVSGTVGSDEHAEAEYELLQQTQSWHTALSERDKHVSVANIRRFCENSRPVLSSQALMALARFYRNSSFTEDVRSKFEYVLTRLFSRDSGQEQRKLLFSRNEMVGHIRTLYNNWSSITYHSDRDHRAEIELAVQRFEDIVKHFEGVGTFDELLNADVFNTIRHFKEECGELFFVPEVASAAVECNVRLGNKYVDLLFKERSNSNAAALEAKYGYAYDQAASGAAGKTLLLVDLLKQQPEQEIAARDKQKPEFEQESFEVPTSTTFIKNASSASRSKLFGVSRWLVFVTLFAVAASVGLYFGADRFAGGTETVKVANEIDLDGSDLKAHIRTMRVSQETAYAVAQPSWDALSEFEQKEFLKKIFEFAQSKGMKKVNVLNYKGRTVAFASKDRFELLGPG